MESPLRSPFSRTPRDLTDEERDYRTLRDLRTSAPTGILGEVARGWEQGVTGAAMGAEAQRLVDAQIAGDKDAEARAANYMLGLRRQAEVLSPTVQSAKDVHDIESGIRYGLGAIGQTVQSATPAIAAGLLTRGAGRFATPSTYAGALVPSYIQNQEAALVDQLQDSDVANLPPEQRMAMSRTVGAGQAALDALLPTKAVGTALKKAGVKGTARAAAEGALIEAPTEALQQEVSYQGLKALGSTAERDPWDYIDSALSGGIGGAGVNVGAHGLSKLADQFKDADWGAKFNDAKKKATSPLDAVKRTFSSMRDRAEPILLGDSDPTLLGKTDEETMANFTQRDLDNNALTGELAYELLNDKDTPDSVKQQIKDMGGNFMDKGNQAIVATNAMAKDAKVKAKQIIDDGIELSKRWGKAAQSFVAGVKEGVTTKKNLMEPVGDEKTAYSQTVFDGLTDEAKSNPEVRARLPELANMLVAFATRTGDLTKTDMKHIARINDVLDLFKDPQGVADKILAHAGAGGVAGSKFLQNVRNIRNAQEDVEKPNSYLALHIQDAHGGQLTTSQMKQLARLIDSASVRELTKSEDKLLEAVFGSKEAANNVLAYYGHKNKATLVYEAPQDSNNTGVEEKEAPEGTYHFSDAKSQRPFRKFAGKKLSSGKIVREAVTAAKSIVAKQADSKVLPVSMSEYVEKTGGNPEAEVKRIANDVKQRIKDHEARNTDGTRTTTINQLKGELALMRDLYKQGGAKAVLDQYEVLNSSAGREANDLVATDTDLSKMHGAETAKDGKATAITFQRADGSRLRLSAENMWKYQGRKESNTASGRGEPSRARMTRLFYEALGSVLARPDITGVIGAENGQLPRIQIDRKSNLWTEKTKKQKEQDSKIAASLREPEVKGRLKELQDKLDAAVDKYEELELGDDAAAQIEEVIQRNIDRIQAALDAEKRPAIAEAEPRKRLKMYKEAQRDIKDIKFEKQIESEEEQLDDGGIIYHTAESLKHGIFTGAPDKYTGGNSRADVTKLEKEHEKARQEAEKAQRAAERESEGRKETTNGKEQKQAPSKTEVLAEDRPAAVKQKPMVAGNKLDVRAVLMDERYDLIKTNEDSRNLLEAMFAKYKELSSKPRSKQTEEEQGLLNELKGYFVTGRFSTNDATTLLTENDEFHTMPKAERNKLADEFEARWEEMRADNSVVTKNNLQDADVELNEVIPGHQIVDYHGRRIVTVTVNGLKLPFYISTGSGGKANVASGKWYPFFGLGPDGWLNKTSEKDINSYYGSPVLRQIAEHLDATMGDVRSKEGVPSVGLNQLKPILNHGLRIDAVANGSHGGAVQLYKNIKYVTERIGRQSAMGRKAGRIKDLTPEEKQAVIDEVVRIRGKDIKVSFERFAKGEGSGSYTHNPNNNERLIRIAVNALNPTSVAWHESLHDFFAMLDGSDPTLRKLRKDLIDAANAPHVVKRLNELLKDHKGALEQLKDPEERVAYMYQFWAEGELVLGKTGTSIFERFTRFIRELLGAVSKDQKTEELLNALHTGKFAEPNLVAAVLKDLNASTVGDKISKMTEPIHGAANAVFTSATDRLRGTNIQALTELADMFHREPGHERGGLPFLQKRSQQVDKRLNQISEILAGTTAAERRAALENMQGMKAPSNELEQKLAGFFKEMRDYMVKAGVKRFDPAKKEWVEMGDVENYFPRNWNKEYIADHQVDFVKALTKYMPITHAKKVADAIIKGDGTEELNESEHHLGFTPWVQALENRKLEFIDASNAAEFTKFMNKDIADILTTYIQQGVHRAEYARYFGNNGEVIAQKFAEAQKQGATKQELETANKAVMALEGTLGHDMNPRLKELMSGIMTYENVILLPLALFSSLIDPLGVGMRSNSMKEAGKAFLTGMEGIAKAIAGSKDEKEDMARTIGLISDQNMLEAMGHVYNSMYMSRRMKKVNNVFFRLNGMELWNRRMRVAAMMAGQRFIAKNVDNQRYMNELGITKEDVHELPDGTIALTKDQLIEAGVSKAKAEEMELRIQDALFKFVDGAVLRPNAAHRPIWGSDPRWALVFHLKQFTFSFQQTILKRVGEEFRNGNNYPMWILLSYVPFMIAADVVRGSLTGTLKTNADLFDMLSSGIMRSGIAGAGVFGMDTLGDTAHGNLPGTSFLGPSYDHLSKILSGVAGDASTSSVVLRSIPGGAALRGAF